MSFVFQPASYPQQPGCYLMKNGEGRVIYVGKAKNLRNRLRSYFRGTPDKKRIRELVANIADIEVVLVNNEPESLILENNLIKQYKPKYNRALKKDNSGYAYLQLTDEEVPRFDVYYRNRKPGPRSIAAAAGARACIAETSAAREPGSVSAGPRVSLPASAEGQPAAAQLSSLRPASKNRQPDPGSGSSRQPASAPARPRLSRLARADAPASRTRSARGAGASPAPAEVQRFGPYASSRFRNALLEFLVDHYKIRTCRSLPKRACLLYHIGKCSGVCEGYISIEEYQESVRQAASLLANKDNELLEEMRRRMERYADRLEFEKAQNVMLHIRALEKTMVVKQVVDREVNHNQDVIYFGDAHVLVARLQEGMVRDFTLHELNLSGGPEPAADRFLIDRYKEEERPDEIIVNRIHDLAQVKAALRSRTRNNPRITIPKRGLKHELLQLCRQNYEYRMQNYTD